MNQACDHHVTLETDHLRGMEVIRCVRCGRRAEIPFVDLAQDPGDGTETFTKYIYAAFGIPVAPIEKV